MMLRRLKDDVEKGLAPKEETIIEVELTAVQKQYYRAILEHNFSFLSKSSHSHGTAVTPSLLNTMMELRKCCNHPFLVKGIAYVHIRMLSSHCVHTYLVCMNLYSYILYVYACIICVYMPL